MGQEVSTPQKVSQPVDSGMNTSSQKVMMSQGDITIQSSGEYYTLNLPNDPGLPSSIRVPAGNNELRWAYSVFDTVCNGTCNVGNGLCVRTADGTHEVVFFINDNNSPLNIQMMKVLQAEYMVCTQTNNRVTRNYHNRASVECMVDDSDQSINVTMYCRDVVCGNNVSSKEDAVNAFATFASYGIADNTFKYATVCTNKYNPDMSQRTVLVLNDPVCVYEQLQSCFKSRALLKMGLVQRLNNSSLDNIESVIDYYMRDGQIPDEERENVTAFFNRMVSLVKN